MEISTGVWIWCHNCQINQIGWFDDSVLQIFHWIRCQMWNWRDAAEECNRFYGHVDPFEVYPSNSVAERNYIRHFLSGKLLRVSTLEVNSCREPSDSMANSSIDSFVSLRQSNRHGWSSVLILIARCPPESASIPSTLWRIISISRSISSSSVQRWPIWCFTTDCWMQVHDFSGPGRSLRDWNEQRKLERNHRHDSR